MILKIKWEFGQQPQNSSQNLFIYRDNYIYLLLYIDKECEYTFTLYTIHTTVCISKIPVDKNEPDVRSFTLRGNAGYILCILKFSTKLLSFINL